MLSERIELYTYAALTEAGKDNLMARVAEKMEADNLSSRDVERQCGVSFSAVARLVRTRKKPSIKVQRAFEAWLAGQKFKPKRMLCSQIVMMAGKRLRVSVEEI